MPSVRTFAGQFLASRVVGVSSHGQHLSGIRWDDVHFERGSVTQVWAATSPQLAGPGGLEDSGRGLSAQLTGLAQPPRP